MISKKLIVSGELERRGISLTIWLRGFIADTNESHSFNDLSPLNNFILFLKGSCPTSKLKFPSGTLTCHP